MTGEIILETEYQTTRRKIESGDQKKMYEAAAELKKDAAIMKGDDYQIYVQFPSKMNFNSFYNQKQ